MTCVADGPGRGPAVVQPGPLLTSAPTTGSLLDTGFL